MTEPHASIIKQIEGLKRDVSDINLRVQEIERNGLSSLLADVRPFLKGYRTKLVGWLSSLPMITLAGGFAIDPQVMSDTLAEHGYLAALAQLGLSALTHHYRNRAEGPK